jgi:16S rRNA (guanine(966)-N(2))-methyltransferase RsmD
MRIISGIYKGRNLIIPPAIRPTQNKVRKAVFDVLGDLEGLSVLELFAGSGAVGFEALSWGAKDLTLVEIDRDCLKAINLNIEALKLNNCQALPLDAEAAVKILEKNKRRFDLVFVDPPYYQDLPKKALQTIAEHDILTPYGFVVIQHFKRDELPDKSGELILIKRSKYGATYLSFYRRS